MKFKIISAVDDNEKYMSFIPSVSKMWFNITGEKLILGFITNRMENDERIISLKQIVDLRIFRPIIGIPPGNQAKVTRMYLASETKEKSMIVDLDMYVLNNEVVKWTNGYEENKLITIGSNAYYNSPSNGKFPMCYTMGNGYIFKKIINNENLSYEQLLNKWCKIKNPIDGKEFLNQPHNIFSDESLIRYLIYKTNNQNNIINIIRDDFVGMIATKRIDRINMNFNKEKLYSGYYIDCAPYRPLRIETMKEIFNYLKIKNKK